MLSEFHYRIFKIDRAMVNICESMLINWLLIVI